VTFVQSFGYTSHEVGLVGVSYCRPAPCVLYTCHRTDYRLARSCCPFLRGGTGLKMHHSNSSSGVICATEFAGLYCFRPWIRPSSSVFIGRLWIGLLSSECEKKRIFLATEAIYLHVCRVVVELVTRLNLYFVCRVVVELVTRLNLYCDKRSALGYSVTTPKNCNVQLMCVV
jgi:hypothetical protein